MKFTFGIITGGSEADPYTNFIIDSIESQNIPNDCYEIIIVGNSNINRTNTTIIPFDENIKRGWITKKKNLITSHAQFENIVYTHDYVALGEDWYKGQLQSGNDFSVRMDKILNCDGTRYRDWCIWPHNGNHMDKLMERKECLIPYDMTHLSKYMYISGMYWIAKKDIMEKYPLDESLVWGQGEDVEWSKRIRNNHNFDMNVNSYVYIIKPGKDKAFTYTSFTTAKILKNVK